MAQTCINISVEPLLMIIHIGDFDMEGNYTVYRRKMYYYETDQMGIVHHSNYIKIFEESRLDLMEKWGLNYASMEHMGVIIPVLSVECHYLLPLCYNDSISVHTRMTKFDGIKINFEYEIYKEGCLDLHTSGRTGHCFLNQDMKPFRMKKLYPDLYNKLSELGTVHN